MKKTLMAVAAIAALGTGIVTAQAETGYQVNEDLGITDQMTSTVPAAGDAFLTNDGHNF